MKASAEHGAAPAVQVQSGLRCGECSGRGWHRGDCHPFEVCGQCNGFGDAAIRPAHLVFDGTAVRCERCRVTSSGDRDAFVSAHAHGDPRVEAVVKVYYFGAWGGPGHHVWTPDGGSARAAGPWTDRDLDAPSYDRRGVSTGRGFVPPDQEETQGVRKLTRGCSPGLPWTAVGCYDRSQDHRRGSVSIFVAEGERDEQAMRALAAQHFPAVWARIHGRPS